MICTERLVKKKKMLIYLGKWIDYKTPPTGLILYIHKFVSLSLSLLFIWLKLWWIAYMSFTLTSLSKSLIYLYVFIELVFSVLWMSVCVLWCSRKYTAFSYIGLDTGAHISHSDLCALFTNWTYFIALFAHKHAIIGRFFRNNERKKERKKTGAARKMCVNDLKARRWKRILYVENIYRCVTW